MVLQHDGEAYVLDITGGQYGYYSPVDNWDEFVVARVSDLLDFLKAQARLDCRLLQEAHEIAEGKKHI